MMGNDNLIILDGIEFDIEELDAEAQRLARRIQEVDIRAHELQQELELVRAAGQTFANELGKLIL